MGKNKNIDKKDENIDEVSNNKGKQKNKKKVNFNKSFNKDKKHSNNKQVKNKKTKNNNFDEKQNHKKDKKNENSKENKDKKNLDSEITAKILSEDFTDLLSEADKKLLVDELGPIEEKTSVKKTLKEDDTIEESDSIEEDETIENEDSNDSEFLTDSDEEDFSKLDEDKKFKSQTLKLATIQEIENSHKDKEELEKEVKEDINKIIKTNQKKKYGLFVFIIIAIIALVFSTIFAFLNMQNDKILENIFVSNIYVGDMTKSEALDKIKSEYDSKKSKDLSLKLKDYEYKISPEDISYNPIFENAVNEAYDIGRGNNIFLNNYTILNQKYKSKNLTIDEKYDREALDDIVKSISLSIPGITKQPSYNKDEDKLLVYPGEKGRELKSDELKKEILSKFKSRELDSQLQIPYNTSEPDPIDMDKIYKEVKLDPKDASYDKKTGKVTIEEKGLDFAISLEEAKAKLKENKKEYIIPLKVLKPKITLRDLGQKIFNKTVSSDSTRYNASQVGRTNNLRLVAKKINGYILKPGEVFSFNRVVGKRTIDAGYRNAPIYANGKVVDDIGGGICQISTTLYGAALRGGFEVVERTNHRFPTSYAKPGTDATVYYGALDFKFKNNKDYAVKIDVSVGGGVARATIRGIKDDNIKVNIATRVIERTPRSVKVKETSELKKGEQKVIQSGKDGLKVVTSIERVVNGKSQGWKVISRDTYKPQERIILKGTAVVPDKPKVTKKTKAPEKKPKPEKPETEKPKTKKPENSENDKKD